MTTMNRKVFIVQESPRINYSPAMEFGEVRIITSKEYKPEPTDGFVNGIILQEIKHELIDYLAGSDYILTSGSPATLLAVGIELGRMYPTGVLHKILKWNNQTNRYEICYVKF